MKIQHSAILVVALSASMGAVSSEEAVVTSGQQDAGSPATVLGAPSEGTRLDVIATLTLIESGDAVRGETIAESKEAKCTRCHGDAGVSDEEDTPSIAGQLATYTFKQLMDYKTGARENRSMRGRVKRLSMQDMADLAAYYAAVPGLAVSENTAEVEPPPLVTQGDPDRFLLPCSVCHGKAGEGMKYEVPALAGQQKQHLIDTMMEYKDGDRTNDVYGRMRFVASRLSEEEITDLATFYSSLGGS